MLDVSIVSERIRYPSISSHGTVTNTPYHSEQCMLWSTYWSYWAYHLPVLLLIRAPVTADSETGGAQTVY
jgi:hypothetical protein